MRWQTPSAASAHEGAADSAPWAALALSEAELPEPEAEGSPRSTAFLRTLYIQEQGTWLRLNRGRFVITAGREPREERLSLPAFKVDHILVFGNCLITPAALRYCLRHEIPVLLLSSRGSYHGALEPGMRRNLGRQRVQFMRSMDDAFRLAFARTIVAGKLHNQRVVLQRQQRRLKEDAVTLAIQQMRKRIKQLDAATSLDQGRGYEGQGSALYFGVFDHLLRDSAFTFAKRSRRPPADPVNALLSLGYTLLFGNIYAFLRLHRLHPYVGFLHDEREGHPALVSDLVEEFRFLIDRLVLGLCNKRMLRPEQFTYRDAAQGGGCFMDADARKTFIHAFEQAIQREIVHPSEGRRLSFRRCLQVQVRLLMQHLEEGTPYVPFRIKP